MSQKTNTLENTLDQPQVINKIDAANSPLVKPEEVHAGRVSTLHEKAILNTGLSVGLVKGLSERAEADKIRLVHQAECAEAVGAYYKVVQETEAVAMSAMTAQERIEQATARVSRAFADAILAHAYDRSKSRQKLGEAFGFKEGKRGPTSAPQEPGNSIAKRVASVTIAAEYAMTGELPDRGGDNLPLLGQERVQELLWDYFPQPVLDSDGKPKLNNAGEPVLSREGCISVRTASERIEAAIREAKTTLPLELSADKLQKLAGKIETASQSIAKDMELRDAYVTLFQVIAAIPFGDDEEDTE